MNETNLPIPFLQRRLTITFLMILGAALLIFSFFLPYWEMHLAAPQYPDGLHVYTYLDGVKGDTAEINELNHYIGMGKIEVAAEFERSIAWVTILGMAIGGVIIGAIPFRTRWLFYMPPSLFLPGFVADFAFQMYRFGHILDPNAPIKLAPFMPSILGTGKIGQFTSTAYFSSGFWIAFVACLIFVFALKNKKS